jgi:hypothetical protein
MDGPGFDWLARRLATDTNRRRAVRFLGASMASMLLGRGTPTAARDEGTLDDLPVCSRDSDCEPGLAPDPCVSVSCEGDLCITSIVECMPGFHCCGGGCVAPCGAGQTLDASCLCVGSEAVAGSDDSILVAAGSTPTAPLPSAGVGDDR